MAQTLTRSPGSGRRLYYAIAATGLVILGLHALRLVGTAELVTIPTTLFVVVYVGAMAAATVVLRGASAWPRSRRSSRCSAILAFSGWASSWRSPSRRRALAIRRAGRSGQQDELAAAAPVRDGLMSGARPRRAGRSR